MKLNEIQEAKRSLINLRRSLLPLSKQKSSFWDSGWLRTWQNCERSTESLKIDRPRAERGHDVRRGGIPQVFRAGQFRDGRKWKTFRQWLDESFRGSPALSGFINLRNGARLTITRSVDAKELTNWTRIVLRDKYELSCHRRCTWLLWISNSIARCLLLGLVKTKDRSIFYIIIIITIIIAQSSGIWITNQS